MDSSSDEQESPRRRTSRRRVSATTTRVPRRTTTRRSLAARRQAEEEVAEQAALQEEIQAQKRKAPTPIADEAERALVRKKQFITVAIVMLIGVAASAGVGYMEEGRIDVIETIEARNERIRNNQADERDVITSLIEVPVQNTTERKADGGLIGRGTGGRAPEPNPSDLASTTASSTDEMASSTEAIASSTEAVAEEAQPSAAPQEDSSSEEEVTQ